MVRGLRTDGVIDFINRKPINSAQSLAIISRTSGQTRSEIRNLPTVLCEVKRLTKALDPSPRLIALTPTTASKNKALNGNLATAKSERKKKIRHRRSTNSSSSLNNTAVLASRAGVFQRKFMLTVTICTNPTGHVALPVAQTIIPKTLLDECRSNI